MCQTYPIYGQEKNNGYTSWHKLTGGGGGGVGTPLHKPVVQYVLPQRIFFFAPFWSENGYTFCPFSSRIE